MITKKINILLIVALLLIQSFSVLAQKTEDPIDRILFIFDASYSMTGRWESGRKIDRAKELLSNMVDSLKNIENLEIGLRVYGHRSGYPPPDCEDTHLEIGFLKANTAVDIIKKKLSVIKSRGTTPIGRSLEEGAKDLKAAGDARNIVILITDGKEECGMDPCAVSRFYQKEGIILKPFVIGIGTDESWKKSFDCIGRFFDAAREQDFTNILNIVLSHVIDNTTAQVNLLDANGEPTETNVNMTFYNGFGIAKYNYVHTMNPYGHPDTMVIDPIGTYKVVAHTIPPVSIDSVTLNPGKHTIIPLETPQGKLQIKMNSKINYQCIVRPEGVDSTLHVQKINDIEKYLIGKYDIEVLTLPRFKFPVEILPIETAQYSIPTPGLANIILPSKGYGGLYLKNGDQLEQIYRFNNEKKNHRLTLLPGYYKVVFRARAAKEYLYTKEKDFIIKSGKSELIKIY